MFAVDGRTLFFVSGMNRGKVVALDLDTEGYPETAIVFPQTDLFQISFDQHSQLVGVGESSGLVAFFDLRRVDFSRKIELPSGK